MSLVERYSINHRGRDFVVGDIHGMFSLLDERLAAIDFNPRADRLFSVGDLVDRGPDSRRALEFIKRPWFHAVRGNHDQFVIEARPDPFWYDTNGGRWWKTVPRQTREALTRHFSKLPYIIEVETAQGTVGIVHADIPGGIDWPTFVGNLADNETWRTTALWGRSRYDHQDASGIEGIWRVFCGHSITRDWQPAILGNVCFIDTGAFCQLDGVADAKLTLVPLDAPL